MSSANLLKHFDQISEAPDAVPRLRRFILDLAVRGKLVEQDPKDEQTSVAEPVDLLFHIPAPWKWKAISALGKTQTGSTPPTAERLHYDGSVPFIKPAAICEGLVNYEGQGLTESGVTESTVVQAGAILMVCIGGSIGKAALVDRTVCFNQQINSISPNEGIDSRYILIAMLSPYFKGRVVDTAAQGTLPIISKGKWEQLLIPLPPLAEQHRIVAKVDELMKLCDDLEATQAKREKWRDRLVAATLHGLNNGEANDENGETLSFEESARFYFNHLPRLTTRPEHIWQLRQTILNLAVRGKLVPQDPKDEPAVELLRKIESERVRLLESKGLSKQKTVEPSTHLEDNFEIPASWQFCYLQNLAYQITDGTHLTPKYTEIGCPFLSAQNVKPFRFLPDNHRFVSEKDFNGYRANRKPERGDVLLTRVGAGIGEAAVLDSDMEFAFYVSLALIKIPTRYFLPEFLVIWLNSPTGRGYSSNRTYGKGFSQGNLNLGLIRTFRIPVPPYREQHRIVAKVDEIMKLCDELASHITITSTTSRRLLESTLHKALVH